MHIDKDYYLEQLRNNDPYKRSKAVLALAHCRERNVFPFLLPLAFDDELLVRRDTLISLGISQDSRAYFFLANYFFFAEQHFPKKESLELQKSVLFSFRANKDPRAIDLLHKTKQESEELESLASSILRAYAHHPRAKFPYTYMEKEEERKNAEQFEGKLITCQKDLQSLDGTLRDDALWGEKHFERPQSYVVTLEGTFLLGEELQEHVQVASGQDLLAAGEAYMKKEEEIWLIRELNNRSTGYYPHADSFIHVKNALSQTDIRFPSEFTEVYPKGGWLDHDLLAVYRSNLFPKKK